MKIEAVFFDLDDTLTDWHGAVSGALDDVGGDEGLSRRQIAEIREAMRRFVCVERDGRIIHRQHWQLTEAREPWETVLGYGIDIPRTLERFREALLPRLQMYDDVEVLNEVAGRWRVAMLTNNPFARTVLEDQGHAHRFEAIVMAEQAYRKPHPRAFATAAATIGCEASNLVYVGDSIEADIEGALAAGWTPIWIDRFEDGYQLPGVERITTLHELPDALRRIECR